MKNKRVRNAIVTFLISTAMFVAVMLCCGIYPFGDNSFITGDLNSIYIPEYMYVKDVISGVQDFGYSFQKSLGENTTGMFAYYTASPLLLLLAFFEKKQVINFATLLFGIKVIICATGADLYLTNKYKNMNYEDIILSLGYAFMSYNFAYYQNIMWLDVVMLLPLILMGVDYILEGKSPFTYILFLALSVFSNFYIAFMGCIFIALYFMWQYLEMHSYQLKKLSSKSIINFALGSLCGGLLPMFMVMPGLMNIFSVKSVGGNKDVELTYSVVELIKQFIPGWFECINVEKGMPFLYTGMFCLVATIMYFTTDDNWKSKAATVVTGVILVLSFVVPQLNLLFHGMTAPVWFPHRHAFLFAMWMLITAGKTFNRGTVGKKQLVLSGVVVVLLCIAQLVMFWYSVSKKNIVLGLVIGLAAVIALAVPAKYKRFAIMAIGAVTCAELVFSSQNMVKQFEPYPVTVFESHLEYMEAINAQADEITEKDFYRLERTYFRTLNDAFLMGYNGISHFDSTRDNVTSGVLEKLNYKLYGGCTYGSGGGILGDALLGIEFVVSETEQKGLVSIGNGLWKNEYAVPFAVAVKENAKEANDLVRYFNDVYSALAGESLTVAEYSRTTDEHNVHIVEENGYFVIMSNDDADKIVTTKENEKITEFTGNCKEGVLNVGYLTKGSQIILKSIDGDISQYQMYMVPEAAINKASAAIKRNAVEYEVNKAEISVNHNAKDDVYVFLNVPYSEEWEITVNGNAVEAEKMYGYFMGIPITAGENAVEMKFVPAGSTAGIVISAVALLTTAALLFLNRKKQI